MKNSIYLLLLLISRYCSAQQIPLIPLPDQYSKTRGDFIVYLNPYKLTQLRFWCLSSVKIALLISSNSWFWSASVRSEAMLAR